MRVNENGVPTEKKPRTNDDIQRAYIKNAIVSIDGGLGFEDKIINFDGDFSVDTFGIVYLCIGHGFLCGFYKSDL